LRSASHANASQKWGNHTFASTVRFDATDKPILTATTNTNNYSGVPRVMAPTYINSPPLSPTPNPTLLGASLSQAHDAIYET
jgi:hypothetical protein